MPELPEVETVRRALARHVIGRKVRSVWLSGLALRKPVPPQLVRKLRGRTVRGVRRHGKFLLIDLDDGARVVAHLGMTGHFTFHAKDPGPPSRLAPFLQLGTRLTPTLHITLGQLQPFLGTQPRRHARHDPR